MKDIIYYSNVVSTKYHNKLIKEHKNYAPHQFQKFNYLLIEGLMNNGKKIVVVSGRSFSRRISKKIFYGAMSEVEETITFIYLPFINLPLLRQVSLVISSLFVTLYLFIKHKKPTIMTDCLNFSTTLSGIFLSKIFRIKSIGVITDLPNHLVMVKNKVYSKLVFFLIKRYNFHILLTNDMAKYLRLKQNYYIIIEGFADKKMNYVLNNFEQKYEEFTFLYAGSINEKHGIQLLVKAFLACNFENTQLIIYGLGDYEDKLKEVCEINHNIIYKGSAANNIVVSDEIKSTVLVNPRPTAYEYTRYSFPSKIMEYLSSGTPVISTKLPGIPKDYNSHFYFIENDSIDSYINTLIAAKKTDRIQLHNKGIASKEFVMKNKTNDSQAMRIIQWFEEISMKR